jgi:hypothetical protein
MFTIGRGIAVPLSFYYKTPKLLLILIIGSLITIILSILSFLRGFLYISFYIGSCFYGLFMSAMLPLMMSLPNFMKMTILVKQTSGFVLWTAVG